MVNRILNFGIIGLGNMGSVIAKLLLEKQFPAFNKYFVYDIIQDRIKSLNNYPNVMMCANIAALVENSDFILLAVKPQVMKFVLEEISKQNYEGKTFITIAAGLKINFYRQILIKNCSIVRIMPNTPLLVGEGAAAIALDPDMKKDNAQIIDSIFKLCGKVIYCEEKYLDVVTALSGSGPAYFFIMIEALADGAVKMGLSRDQAYLLAAQTAIGAGKMILETNKHPGVLKDMVTSPGGTTIEAITILERGKFRSILIDAIEAATKKSQSLNP
jgi:pyrroline-5-carboxylate reductase